MKVLGRNGQMLDVIDRRAAFTLEQAAVDSEVLAARGMEDEVRRAGDRTTGAKWFIKKRGGRELMMSRQSGLGWARERAGVCDDGFLGDPRLRDRLGRVEHLGELLEVRHGHVHGCFWADSSR